MSDTTSVVRFRRDLRLHELDPLPPEAAHVPWTLSPDERAARGVELGVDYPEPMVDPTAL